MIQLIEQLLKENQIASAGLLVLFSGSVLAIFWRCYGYLLRLINYLLFVNIDFTSIDRDSFLPIQAWLFNQEYTKKRCSNLMVRHIKGDEDNTKDKTNGQVFIPSYGTHYFLFNWRPTILIYTKSENTRDGYSLIEFISIRMFCLFGKLKFAQKIVEDATILFKENIYKETLIYTDNIGYDPYWSVLTEKKIKQPPILDTPEAFSYLVNDLAKFIKNEDWYHQRGINYKRGYLFTGPPGNGKTTCIIAMAQYLKRHVCLLNLSDNKLTDSKFISLVSTLPKNSVLAIEDLTQIKQPIKKGEKGALSISSILNILDGLLTPNKLIFFITSNHPETLDEAIKRPGRIDIYKTFDNANEYQIRTIFKRFLPNVSSEEEFSFVKENLGKSMSYLESELIKLTNQSN